MTPQDVASVSLPPLQRVSSVEAAMDVLREQVFAGVLVGGMPLREAPLAEQLNVSRHTLRVALSNLAHEGVVRLEANRGAFVRELAREDIEDCYRLRELLELTAVQAVTGKTELLHPVREALQELVRVGSESSWSLSREADLEFHRSIVAALGSPRILQTYESLLTDLRLCFLVEGFEQLDQAGNAAEHAELLAGIEGGDVSVALDLTRSHLERSRLRALQALETT